MGKGWTAADVPQAKLSATVAPPRPSKVPSGVTIPPRQNEARSEPKRSASQQAAHEVRSPVRWYSCKATDEGLLQVKFAGVPKERLHELIAAAQAVFPELRQY